MGSSRTEYYPLHHWSRPDKLWQTVPNPSQCSQYTQSISNIQRETKVFCVKRKNTLPRPALSEFCTYCTFMCRLQSHALSVLLPSTCVQAQGRGEVVYTRFSEPDRVWWRGSLEIVWFVRLFLNSIAFNQCILCCYIPVIFNSRSFADRENGIKGKLSKAILWNMIIYR